MVPKPISEALTWATIRLKEYRNVRIDKIMKIRMLKQALCKEVMPTLLESFMGIVIIMSGWNNSLTQYCKTTTC